MSAADLDQTAAAVTLVDGFLSEIGVGDLASAAGRLHPDAVLVFPGGRTFRDLDALAGSSASRYRSVDKHRDEYVGTSRPDGTVMVVSVGRLFGENLHGVRFDGVRYVDIFTVRDGAIVEQRVWNDLAEAGVLSARSDDELSPVFRVDPS